MNIVEETGIGVKGVGSLLSSKEVNQINQTLNQEVAVGNSYLRNYCNVNAEIENYNRQFNLASALEIVPPQRRTPGMTIKFRNYNNFFSEYTFSGEDISEWSNTDLWKNEVATVDGGEW